MRSIYYNKIIEHAFLNVKRKFLPHHFFCGLLLTGAKLRINCKFSVKERAAFLKNCPPRIILKSKNPNAY